MAKKLARSGLSWTTFRYSATRHVLALEKSGRRGLAGLTFITGVFSMSAKLEGLVSDARQRPG